MSSHLCGLFSHLCELYSHLCRPHSHLSGIFSCINGALFWIPTPLAKVKKKKKRLIFCIWIYRNWIYRIYALSWWLKMKIKINSQKWFWIKKRLLDAHFWELAVNFIFNFLCYKSHICIQLLYLMQTNMPLKRFYNLLLGWVRCAQVSSRSSLSLGLPTCILGEAWVELIPKSHP